MFLLADMWDQMSGNDVIPVVAVVSGCGIAAVSIIACTMKSIFRSRAMEQSRREIAAYVAEGSMSPEEGERLLNAGKSARCAGKA